MYAAPARPRRDDAAAPGRFRLLAAAESAGALLAAEMGSRRPAVERPATTTCCASCWVNRRRAAAPPRKLVALADEISAAFGGARVRPDSPAEVLRGVPPGRLIRSRRPGAWELRGIDHPAVPLLRRYKELYRIWTAHGWAWRQMWVRDGRFHAEVRPGRRRLRPLGDAAAAARCRSRG